jgi:hypothetical protein
MLRRCVLRSLVLFGFALRDLANAGIPSYRSRRLSNGPFSAGSVDHSQPPSIYDRGSDPSLLHLRVVRSDLVSAGKAKHRSRFNRQRLPTRWYAGRHDGRSERPARDAAFLMQRIALCGGLRWFRLSGSSRIRRVEVR